MTNPYFIGLGTFSAIIGNALQFQNDLFKIGLSTINACPLTIWNKLIIKDIIEESTSWVTSLNRTPSIK